MKGLVSTIDIRPLIPGLQMISVGQLALGIM